MIESNSVVLVYGVKGCGKTSIISDVFRSCSVFSIRINCIQCSTKGEIISKIINSLGE